MKMKRSSVQLYLRGRADYDYSDSRILPCVPKAGIQRYGVRRGQRISGPAACRTIQTTGN